MALFDVNKCVTIPASPPDAVVPLEDARNVYVSRTCVLLRPGKRGIAIIDVEKPEEPRLKQILTADGKLANVRDPLMAATVFAALDPLLVTRPHVSICATVNPYSSHRPVEVTQGHRRSGQLYWQPS